MSNPQLWQFVLNVLVLVIGIGYWAGERGKSGKVSIAKQLEDRVDHIESAARTFADVAAARRLSILESDVVNLKSSVQAIENHCGRRMGEVDGLLAVGKFDRDQIHDHLADIARRMDHLAG